MQTPDTIQAMQAHDSIRTTVMDNSFTVHHDVDAIVQDFWATFGHFDFEAIDVDTFWATIEKHRIS